MKYNCALFCEIEIHNQFLRIFLYTGKLCLDVTSCFVGVLIVTKCDSLGPLVIFHTFAKCCVLRYYYYVGTSLKYPTSPRQVL